MNKYFHDAFKNVKSTQEEREKIFINIANHSSKKKIFPMKILSTCCLGVFTFGIFFLYNINVNIPSNRTRIVPKMLSYEEILFNGKCYQETTLEKKEIGDYLGMMEKENINCLLYAHKKDDKIVFLFKEGDYIPYEEIVCK